MEKQIGLNIVFSIFPNDENKDISREEMKDFLDELKDIVRKRGWYVSGTIKRLDKDGKRLQDMWGITSKNVELKDSDFEGYEPDKDDALDRPRPKYEGEGPKLLD